MTAATATLGRRVRVGGISVQLSRPEKVYFPGDQITKGELVEYYRVVASRMLPYLRSRPLVLARYPDGITGERFFQKNIPDYFPAWISRAEVAKQDGVVQHVIGDKAATLVYLANQGCIELHVFLSRVGRIDHPDQIVFDLDPPGPGRFGDVRIAALHLRALLEGELGLATFVKSTGGSGLHIHVPLNGRADFGTARDFTRQAAALLAARYPDLVTTEQRKASRGGRIYADVMRNAYAQTVVAPYSVRARPGAPVAMPLHWDEVRDSGLEPGRFTLRAAAARLASGGQGADPWAGMSRRRYGLATARRLLGGLAAS
ncbi:MAG: non-homologous end-joining DNA ligase [Streptosporangiaceae bacterium]